MKHKHHIVPQHIGGANDPSNLIEVTVEEHAAIHRQLWEMLGYWQDYVAWKGLSGQITNAEANRLKLSLSKIGENNPMYNKDFSAEHRKNLSLAKIGKPSNAKGKKLGPRPDHVKEKIKNSLKGKKHSEERIEKNRQGQIMRFSDENERLKVVEYLKKARTSKKG